MRRSGAFGCGFAAVRPVEQRNEVSVVDVAFSESGVLEGVGNTPP